MTTTVMPPEQGETGWSLDAVDFMFCGRSEPAAHVPITQVDEFGGQEEEEVIAPLPKLSSIEAAIALVGAIDGEDDSFRNKAIWPELKAESYMPGTTAKVRFEDNVNALKLVRQLAAEGRQASTDERAALLKYGGWGALSHVFEKDWKTATKNTAEADLLDSICEKSWVESMRASVNSAFYTHPRVVEEVWQAVEHLGFKGGRILEPAGATGLFLQGMPAAIAARSTISLVEIDPASAAIAQCLYGEFGVKVHAKGLEEVSVPPDHFDLVIGNVPFGNFKVADTRNVPYKGWSIHNWFLARSVELVRPGGLVAIITSRHTMDAFGAEDVRQWVANRARLLGAFRLPPTAFDAFAGTTTTTDLLIFQRKAMGEGAASQSEVPWMSAHAQLPEVLCAPGGTLSQTVYSRPTGSGEVTAKFNEYFATLPSNVLCKAVLRLGKYGPETHYKTDGDIETVMDSLRDRCQATLRRGTYQPMEPVAQLQSAPQFGEVEDCGKTPAGTLLLQDNKIHFATGDALLDVDSMYNGLPRDRLLAMMDIRAAANAVLEHQARSEDDVLLGSLQQELNRLYDGFVAKFGYLSGLANARLMREDPSWPRLLGLEIWDEDAEAYRKADVFYRRTVRQSRRPEKVDSLSDALAVSLEAHGAIDLVDMATRLGTSAANVVRQLSSDGLAFKDPQTRCWVPADEYLSGAIRTKMLHAEAAGSYYQSNVEALKKALPRELGPSEVIVKLGAPWVPADVIAQFACELVEASPGTVNVGYDAASTVWSLEAGGGRDMSWVGSKAANTSTWGTPEKCALELIRLTLNLKSAKVMGTTPDGKTYVRVTETHAAKEKQQLIADRFEKWVYECDTRRNRLLKLYNEKFNQIVERKFDGSHLVLPGMSDYRAPRPAQKAAIWRGVCGGNMLLWEAVGAGKTLMLSSIAMELRRLGKASKPLIVVQNSTLEEFTAEFMRIYPNAKVLMASKEMLEGKKRRTFVTRVATGDWDAVIMAHSTFERIPLSPEQRERYLEDLKDEVREALLLAKSGERRTVKQIEARIKNMEASTADMLKVADANSVFFDALGVDYLLVDEAHAFKAVPRVSKMERVAGLPQRVSRRAFDLQMKSRIVMLMRGGREEGLVLSTATWLSTSLAEIHTAQILLQPNTMKAMGLYEFDAWSATFGKVVTGLEVAPDGSGFRMATRYAAFQNTPELMAILRLVAEIKTRADLNLPVPGVRWGKPQVCSLPATPQLKAFTANLVERAEQIRHGGVKPTDDNMLKVAMDGRNAALDLRLVGLGHDCGGGGKLDAVANNVMRIWEERSTQANWLQLVFSDIGVPGGARFDIYSALRSTLINRGMPAELIEFVHDHPKGAARTRLLRRARAGQIAVLLGSTEELGTGTNVQDLLRAIHQIDVPWNATAVEQRDGRGLRPGNTLEEIELWRYVIEGSFDAYSWNLINVKAGFTAQLLKQDASVRVVEDLSMGSMSYAEIKAIATGNPVMMEKAQLDAKIQQLKMSRGHWEDERWRASQDIETCKRTIDAFDEDLAGAKRAEKAAKAAYEKSNFAWLAGLLQKFKKHWQGNHFGLELYTMIYGGKTYRGIRCESFVWKGQMLEDSSVEALQAALNAMKESPQQVQWRFDMAKSDLKRLTELDSQPWPKEQELQEAQARVAQICAELDLDKNEEGAVEEADA